MLHYRILACMDNFKWISHAPNGTKTTKTAIDSKDYFNFLHLFLRFWVQKLFKLTCGLKWLGS